MESEAAGFDQAQATKSARDKSGRHNPLRQMQLIRCGHRPIILDDNGYENTYGLGWFRHMLPSTLPGSIGPNPALLSNWPVINQAGPPRLTIAHWGGFNGFLTALYTFPSTHSAVIVMANSSSGRGDPADLVAQLLVQELFNMLPRVPLEDYALRVADASDRYFTKLQAEWCFARAQNTKHGPIDEYVGEFTNSAFSLTIDVYKLPPTANINPAEELPELLAFTVNSDPQQTAKLRHYHYDTRTFLPDSRDDALWKGMESFLVLGRLLLSFVRDDTGAVCFLDWDLQAGSCQGPAPRIGELVAPIRFQRQEGSLSAPQPTSALSRFFEVFHECSAQ